PVRHAAGASLGVDAVGEDRRGARERYWSVAEAAVAVHLEGDAVFRRWTREAEAADQEEASVRIGRKCAFADDLGRARHSSGVLQRFHDDRLVDGISSIAAETRKAREDIAPPEPDLAGGASRGREEPPARMIPREEDRHGDA